jgi:hypothetical protein
MHSFTDIYPLTGAAKNSLAVACRSEFDQVALPAMLDALAGRCMR